MGFFYRHAQYFGNAFAFVLDLQRFAVVALAVTNIARHINIRQKVHLYLDDAIALTRFATTAFDVE